MRTTRSSSNALDGTDRTPGAAASSMQASNKKRSSSSSSSNGMDGMPGGLAAAAAAASSSPQVLLQSCLRLPRSRGSRMLLLVALVVGGLLASSMTLLHHSSSSGFEQSASWSISAKLRAATTEEAAHETQQQQQTSLQEPQQQRHRWRWKFTGKKAAAPPATAAAAQSELGSADDAAGLLLPANLATQLEKQPAAVVTGAAPYQAATTSSQEAAAAAAVTAQPEDVSLILAAAGQVDTRRQQRQQQQETEPLPAGVQDGVDPADATSVYIQQRGVQPVRLRHPLWWHGPMWAGSGYGSEAVNYVLSLLRTGRLAPADIWSYHHGDTWREHVVNSFTTEDRTELEYLQSLPVKYRHTRSAVVVCHSVPLNWAFPEPMWASGAPCPPNPKEFAWVYSVGRTMFETDRLPAVFVPRLNAMTEVWVPSEWQRQSFIRSGVDASKMVVVPEGVNTSLFDPDLYTPLPLRGKAQLVFGRHWEVKLGQEATAVLGADQDSAQSATEPSVADPASVLVAAAAAAAEDLSGTSTGPSTGAAAAGLRKPGAGAATDSARRALRQATHSSSHNSGSSKSSAAGSSRGSTAGSGSAVRQPFRFISTFKWEQRKGWDILLQAYLTAFSADDDVELYILTQPFAKSGSSFKQKMRGWANKLNITHSGGGGRSLLDSTGQQLQHEQQLELGSEHQGVVHDAAALAAHAGDVVQQIKDFAGQLPHTQLLNTQQPQQGVTSPAAAQAGAGHGSTAAAQRRLQAALSARAAGISRLHQQQQHPPAVTKTGPAPPAPNATTTQAAAVAALKEAFAAGAADARHPTLYVVDSHISDADFPRFYKAGDAFVLPSRGEGWGRPHVEAMSMGLPVISTNWSGITAYLDESCGYPIAIDGLVPVSGNGDEIVWWFRGLKWAQPSVTHLAQLMRRVYENRAEAAAKGAAGRARMVEKYSPAAIADVLVRELQRIQDRVP